MITPPGTPEEQAGEYIKDGDFLVGAEAGGLEALQTDAEQIASDAAVLISRGKTTLTTVDGALDDLRSVSAQLGESLDRGGIGEDLAHAPQASGLLLPARPTESTKARLPRRAIFKAVLMWCSAKQVQVSGFAWPLTRMT